MRRHGNRHAPPQLHADEYASDESTAKHQFISNKNNPTAEGIQTYMLTSPHNARRQPHEPELGCLYNRACAYFRNLITPCVAHRQPCFMFC
jgi:hypothetical protein